MENISDEISTKVIIRPIRNIIKAKASELYLKYGDHHWCINGIITLKKANNPKEINPNFKCFG